jgi:hypothetical protein
MDRRHRGTDNMGEDDIYIYIKLTLRVYKLLNKFAAVSPVEIEREVSFLLSFPTIDYVCFLPYSFPFQHVIE